MERLDKNKIYEENKGLIFYTLKKMNLQYDKYYDVALIGFVQALNNYDETKNTNLSTYIVRCIFNILLTTLRYETREMRDSKKEISYNKMITEDSELIDFIADDKVDIEKETIEKENQQELKAYVKVLLSKLKPAYQDIIRKYYGIDTEQKNLVEIAKELNTSHQNINEKYKKAMKQLKEIAKEVKKDVSIY